MKIKILFLDQKGLWQVFRFLDLETCPSQIHDREGMFEKSKYLFFAGNQVNKIAYE